MRTYLLTQRMKGCQPSATVFYSKAEAEAAVESMFGVKWETVLRNLNEGHNMRYYYHPPNKWLMIVDIKCPKFEADKAVFNEKLHALVRRKDDGLGLFQTGVKFWVIDSKEKMTYWKTLRECANKMRITYSRLRTLMAGNQDCMARGFKCGRVA